jgi:hypothetical protein
MQIACQMDILGRDLIYPIADPIPNAKSNLYLSEIIRKLFSKLLP